MLLNNSVLEINFVCNVCGTGNTVPAKSFHRELAFCSKCHSNARFRGLIHALSTGLFNRSICLSDFPEDKSKRGIGMSDWQGYANILMSKFDYCNTFYDRAPFLDIMSDDCPSFNNLDFIISTDVLEHVLHPVSKAFKNIYSMLAPGGLFVFSVPYYKGVKTIEHFPSLHKFQVLNFFNRKILVNETFKGELEIFENLIFHGGEGSTLEMRVFAETDILKMLEIAGFHSLQIFDRPVLPIGYYWPPLYGQKIQDTDRPLLGYIITVRK
jgi:SAM-dependent methyltransferase